MHRSRHRVHACSHARSQQAGAVRHAVTFFHVQRRDSRFWRFLYTWLLFFAIDAQQQFRFSSAAFGVKEFQIIFDFWGRGIVVGPN
jgi:hypothetical protein